MFVNSRLVKFITYAVEEINKGNASTLEFGGIKVFRDMRNYNGHNFKDLEITMWIPETSNPSNVDVVEENKDNDNDKQIICEKCKDYALLFPNHHKYCMSHNYCYFEEESLKKEINEKSSDKEFVYKKQFEKLLCQLKDLNIIKRWYFSDNFHWTYTDEYLPIKTKEENNK